MRDDHEGLQAFGGVRPGFWRLTVMMVWVITLLGFALRIWKISHGLPQVFYSDEGHFVFYALNMGGGDLNTHQFLQPTLFFYLCFFADVLFILAGMAIGLFSQPGDAWPMYLSNPTPFYVVARSVSALLGTLTIPVIYLVGKKVGGRRVGLLAALFFALSYLHVQYSQMALLDVALTFFTTLSFFFAFRAFEDGKTMPLLLSGLAGGLSASVKYSGVVTGLFGVLILLASSWKQQGGSWRSVFHWRVAGFWALFALGFTLGTPFWILDFPKFRSDILDFLSVYRASGVGQIGYDGGRHWLYYLLGPLSYGLGIPLEVAGILGIILLAWRAQGRGLFLIAFPLVFFFSIGSSEIRGARYLMPVVPFLCMSAAHVVVWVVRKCSGEGKVLSGFLLAALSAVVIAPSAASNFRYAYLKMVPDTRSLAQAWIRERVPQESKILQSFYGFLPSFLQGPKVEPLDSTVFDTRVLHRSSLRSLADYRSQGFEYLLLDEWHKGVILVSARRNPKYKLQIEKYESFLAELDRSAELVASFSPYEYEHVEFDPENEQFASRQLWKMKSLGPKLWIYRISPSKA